MAPPASELGAVRPEKAQGSVTPDIIDVFQTVDRSGFPAPPPDNQPWKQFPRTSTETAIKTGATVVTRGILMYGTGGTV